MSVHLHTVVSCGNHFSCSYSKSSDRSFWILAKIMEAQGQLIKCLFTTLGADLHAGQRETTTGEDIHPHAGGDNSEMYESACATFSIPIRQ